MRQRAVIGALLLVVVSVILGATVFRTDIAQATGLAGPTVTVVNTPAQAVPVKQQGTVSVTSTDDPARHAFAFFESDSYESSEKSHAATFTVPEGKRLVIQSVAVNAALTTGVGQALVLAAVQAEVNGDLEDYFLAPTLTGTLEGRDIYVVSQQTTIYADGGTEVHVFATRNIASGSGINLTNASVQGYLLDCSDASCD
jgi:hypothetical protein